MRPLLIVFKRTFAYDFEIILHEDDDENSILNYNEQLNSGWLEFWTKFGEEIVQSNWLRKYSQYLLKENQVDENTITSENNSTEKEETANVYSDKQTQEAFENSLCEKTYEINSFKKQEVLLSNSTETFISETEETVILQDEQQKYKLNESDKDILSDVDAINCQWQELWNTHYTEIYENIYQLYSSVFYNHYTFYKQTQSQQETIENDLLEELEFVDQTEELLALGLPTGFGSSNKNYHKHRVEYSSSNTESEKEEEEEEEEENRNMSPCHQNQQTPNNQSTHKKKRKSSKLKRVPKIILEDKSLRNYWRKRFSLFSRFDEGIQLDRESWFSVTPEKIATHMAERLRCGTIIDAFCGSGGNSIQFARTCERVIAIDIDPEKIKNARHNAEIYGIEHKIDFIIGDYLQLCGSLKGDVVFLSPPWGGPNYISKKEYNIEESLVPLGASELAEKSRQISENIAFFLPRNSNPKHIAKVAGVGNRVEVEHNYLDDRLIGLTAIYGDWLIDKHNLEL